MDLLSPMHIILILLVLVLLFGGKKIPEMMRGLGQGIHEFKKASRLDDEPEKNVEKKEGEEGKNSTPASLNS
jgi:sec-independent protein translocase protein TatA